MKHTMLRVMYRLSLIVLFPVLFTFCSLSAFAHVVVKPESVGVGAFQTFTLGVPVEKDIPTIALRLVIPEDLNHVTPNVKPGWTVTVNKTGEGEEAKVTEIIWDGGSIPVGQRDEFLFSAQVPAAETTILWKAYQTYQDGTVVSWDQASESEEEGSDMGPYSQTNVVNDLTQQTSQTTPESKSQLPVTLSIVALALSAVSLSMQMTKKKK